jgi:hypothetical protein
MALLDQHYLRRCNGLLKLYSWTDWHLKLIIHYITCMVIIQVKVLTTVGSTIPIITPVAIATTLPPAITALQQQGNNCIMF